MNRKIYLFLFLFLLSSYCATAQKDSLLLKPETLGQDDVQPPPANLNDKIKIISGSRFPIAAADLPFSVYVISKEEIRQNGYETLVDALKMAPGIRVSQPGSATDGETFLMRGLPGNSYAKILINDVPVKPSFLASMPIGAQLPVKEAERIEVIYGAGAALYGADASAGVINIITRQSEKPVFMQADLSVGGGSYSSVNVMFGGNLGRGKHILKYFAYAGTTLLEQRNVFYDLDFNYAPQNYTTDVPLAVIPGLSPGSVFTNTPHLSRKFGMTLKYRSLAFSVETMYRRDHSAVGLNPAAVSYRNPLTYTGENILRMNLNFFKNKENRNRKTDITFLSYRIDDRSSIEYRANSLATDFWNVALAEANRIDRDSAALLRPILFQQHYDRYLGGLRYMYGNNGELRIEHVRNYRILKKITLTAGANGKVAGGYPFTGFLSRPPSDVGQLARTPFEQTQFDSITYPLEPNDRGLLEANIFGQLFFNSKHFNLAAGVNQAYYVVEDDFNQLTTIKKLLPRIAGIWKIGNFINIRSSWGQSFRLPNEFYKSISYRIDSDQDPVLQRPFRLLTAEKTTSWESGIRFKSGDQASLDFTWFVNETSDLIVYRQNAGFNQDSTRFVSTPGYINSSGSKIRYNGGQLTWFYEIALGGDRWSIDGQYNFSWTKAKLTQSFGENISLPQFQGRIHQIRTNLHLRQKTTLVFDFIRLNGLGRTAGPNPKEKFWVIDAMGRYALSDRFTVYVKIINLFNQQYSGIPASLTADDLIYNPQNGYFFRLGMNYFLE